MIVSKINIMKKRSAYIVLFIEKKNTVRRKASVGAKIKDIVSISTLYMNGRIEIAKRRIIVEVRFLTDSFLSLR